VKLSGGAKRPRVLEEKWIAAEGRCRYATTTSSGTSEQSMGQGEDGQPTGHTPNLRARQCFAKLRLSGHQSGITDRGQVREMRTEEKHSPKLHRAVALTQTTCRRDSVRNACVMVVLTPALPTSSCKEHHEIETNKVFVERRLLKIMSLRSSVCLNSNAFARGRSWQI